MSDFPNVSKCGQVWWSLLLLRWLSGTQHCAEALTDYSAVYKSSEHLDELLYCIACYLQTSYRWKKKKKALMNKWVEKKHIHKLCQTFKLKSVCVRWDSASSYTCQISFLSFYYSLHDWSWCMCMPSFSSMVDWHESMHANVSNVFDPFDTSYIIAT